MSSCSTMRINYSGKQISEIQSITLISTMIGKIKQPVLPLIDAAAFNEKTNSIADQIMNIQEQNINNYREIVASNLKKSFNCNVIYSETLYSIPEFAELKEKLNFPNALSIENDHYPFIISADGDINPFRYEKGNVISYFNYPAYKGIIAEIMKRVKTDLLAVSYSTLTVVNANAFGISGSLRLDTYIYLFDKSGDLVSDGHSWSKPTAISGKNIEDYLSQLDNISLILDPMLNKVSQNY